MVGSAPRESADTPVDDHPQPGQAFMSALVTEHFVLQSARSATVSEAVGRAAVYLTCVSSSLVAFGFFAAATHRLAPVVATVLPALIILGVFTFVRLVETAVENVVTHQALPATPGTQPVPDIPAVWSLQGQRRNNQPVPDVADDEPVDSPSSVVQVSRRAVCSAATPSRAWLSSWVRGRTASRLAVRARTVTCCLL